MHAPTASLDARTRPRSTTDALSRAVLAGFSASLTMLLLFLVAFSLARLLSATPTPEWPALERPSIIHPASWVDGGTPATASTDVLETPRLWLVNLTHNRLIDASLADVYLAAGIYLAGGLLWAIVYTLVESRLPGAPWQRGVIFAMVPALVSLVVVLPLLGGGLFGVAFGAGPLPAIGNILLHAVYGAILGVVYGPFGDRDASTLERPEIANGDVSPTSYEPTAALALIGGLVIGVLIGVAVSTMTAGSGALALGESSSAMILWGGLLGAVAGLFVGSFLGLGQPDRTKSGP
jgi:hypothetical protein